MPNATKLTSLFIAFFGMLTTFLIAQMCFASNEEVKIQLLSLKGLGNDEFAQVQVSNASKQTIIISADSIKAFSAANRAVYTEMTTSCFRFSTGWSQTFTITGPNGVSFTSPPAAPTPSPSPAPAYYELEPGQVALVGEHYHSTPYCDPVNSYRKFRAYALIKWQYLVEGERSIDIHSEISPVLRILLR